MTNQQIEALCQSIEHWYSNWENCRRISTHEDDCACCTEFFSDECAGCPIFQNTGVRYCKRTPYYDVALSLNKLKETILDEYQYLVKLLLGETDGQL